MAPEKPPFAAFDSAARWLRAWFRQDALPLWAGPGVDAASGGFREALTVVGAPHDPRRRARVQARQVFVFATAAAEGLDGPWGTVARRGLLHFLSRYRRPDGLFVHTLDPAGAVTEPAARLYEHAFILLALSAMVRAEPGDVHAVEALALRERLALFRHPAGGFREAHDPPFQANAQMHLFEAALAWEAVSGEPGWAALADELAMLALEHFVDPATGALHEAFDAGWRPLAGDADAVEPGHQFEWAWLLQRWARARGSAHGQAAAQQLYAVGRRGFDPERGVVVNRLHSDLSVRDAGARLWAQTEFLRAALALGDDADALAAANAVASFLQTPAPGVWRERMRADGTFVDEPAPATSLYHLATAILELG